MATPGPSGVGMGISGGGSGGAGAAGWLCFRFWLAGRAVVLVGWSVQEVAGLKPARRLHGVNKIV